MTTTQISLQPAQATGGPALAAGYDPRLPVPMPYRLDEDGMVLDQRLWQGDPHSCIGFMPTPNETDPSRMLLFSQVPATDPTWQMLVGRYPVFCVAGGGMWNDTRPIVRVTALELELATA